MFDQEIEVLRDKRKQLIRKIVLGIVYCALALWAAWLIYIAIQQFSFGADEATSSSNALSQKAASAEPVLIAATPEAIMSESIASETVTSKIATSQNNASARKAFQQQLIAFDAAHTSPLADADFVQWLSISNQQHEKENITTSKNEALTLFASSRYQDAIAALAQADRMAKVLQQSWHQAYEDKLLEAQQAYSNEKIKPAELYLNQALAIKLTEPRGLSLQQQLKSYPRVAELVDILKIAQAENNLQKQADTLQKILAEDNTRNDLAEELRIVTKALNDQAFSQAMSDGLLAVEKRELSAASVAYRSAKAIYPQRVEVAELQRKISQQQAANNLQAALAKVKQSTQADDWASVLSVIQRQNVKNAELDEYKKNAQDILQQQKTAAAYLARPERLQDEGVRQQANDFIRGSITLTLKSPAFAKQIEQLSQVVDSANQKQTLRITSDGKTDIWVLSVGHVGRVEKATEKTIQLYPGEYIVEGRCEGYRNKQQTITLLPSRSSSTLSSTVSNLYMVCDERI